LNDLYAIEGEVLCDRLMTDARETLDDVIRRADKSCVVDDDCALVGRHSACHDSCAAVVALAAQAEVTDASDAISASTCTAFETAACPPALSPPCVPLTPSCLAGVCVEH